MSRATRLLCLPLFAALVLVGCSSDSSSSDSTTTAGGSTTTNVTPVPADLTFTEPGVPIQVEKGDRFAIQLTAQPSTGYTWTLAAALDGNVLTADGTSYSAGGNGGSSTTSLVGTKGTESLYFVATGTGTAKIDLKYSQPWDTTSPPYDTATFNVTVGAATD